MARRHVRRDAPVNSPPFASSRRTLRSPLAFYDLPPCRIFSLSGPHFSSLRHQQNTKADLPEFYVSKCVIVLAAHLRRLLHRFYFDSAFPPFHRVLCIRYRRAVARKDVSDTCRKFPCIFASVHEIFFMRRSSLRCRNRLMVLKISKVKL